jgi:transcriptional regulator with GAF, ATPase, and Fis domain
MRAVMLAREAGDSRAEAYGFLAIADGGGARPGDRGAAAASARAILDSVAFDADDRLRVMARIVDHGRLRETDDVGAIDALADKASASPSARMDWWGARARQLLRVEGASRAETETPASSRHDVVLAALVALSTTPMAVSARGPALHAGARLSVACGRSDVAERLRPALRDAARTLISRVGPDLAGRAAEIDWVMPNLVTDELSMDAEQVRDLERLVRSLGTGERLGPLLRRVLDALVLWTGVERGLLLLKAPDGRLVPRAARNFARDDLRGEQVALSQSLAHRAIEALEPVLAVDAASELPHVHRSVHALRLRSVLAVPLVARGEALGVAYLDDRIRRGAFGPRELAWARTIAALASSMIADARDQVLLRRAVRSARRSNQRLAETLADREAKLDAAERTLERSASTRGTRHRYEEIVGESEPMSKLLRTLDRVAASDVPVLVVGESGSGKELIARAIHSSGARAKNPFVSENCGAIPEGLLESALFGHVRGAFTGADRPRVGLFEAADGGTLFLDEVGEMSLGMQTKLLRVLEDGLVRPLGTEKPRKVDVRVITATHRDLEAMVRERAFREDLFYRLNIISMRVPPLRERASDIPLLVKRLIDKHAGGRTISVSRAAMQRLSTFGWPGNVRQLENEIRRALVLADEVIDREHISPEIDGGLNGPVAEAGLNVRKRVDLLEGMLVRDALERTRGNQTQAAKLLGLSRFGLQKMMKRLDVTLP